MTTNAIPGQTMSRDGHDLDVWRSFTDTLAVADGAEWERQVHDDVHEVLWG